MKEQMMSSGRNPEALEAGLNIGMFYEIEQLVVQARRAYDHCVGIPERNAALESFLLHARNLLYVFRTRSDKRSRPDDVVSEDFDFPSEGFEIAEAAQERLHKDLAHLTYTSAMRPREEKGWSVGIFLPLFQRCRQFVQHILNTDRVGNQRGQWKQLQSQLEQIIAACSAPV